MKVFPAILLFLLCPFLAAAQEEDGKSLGEPVCGGEPAAEEYLNGMVPVAAFDPESVPLPDSLSVAGGCGFAMPAEAYPRRFAAPWGGGLHEGLNASLDLSAFASFGKNGFSGTAERISMMYARQVNGNLSFAVGGWFENLSSGAGSARYGGLAALVNYRFDTHWEAYVYAQKSLAGTFYAGRRGQWAALDALDWLGSFAVRIGRGVRYNFNESTFLELQLDFAKYPDDFHQNLVRRASR